MAKNDSFMKKNLASKIASMVIISLTGIMLYIGLQIYSDSMYQYYSRSFKKGQIADSDLLVNNSVDIYDSEATEELKLQNSKSVLPVFNYSVEKTLNVISEFEKFRNAFSANDYKAVENFCGDEVTASLKKENGSYLIFISYEILSDILNRGYYSSADVSEIINEGYSLFSLEKNSEEYSIDVNGEIISDYSFQSYVNERLLIYENLSISDAAVILQIISRFINTNVSYDKLLTMERRKAAEDATVPVYVSFEKGQVLIAKDRVITEEQLNLIRLIGNSSTITVSDVLGESAFIIMSMFFAMSLFCHYLDAEKLHGVQYLWIATFALVVTCFVSFFSIYKANSLGISFVESFVPVCFVPVLLTMITGKRNLGFISSLIVALLISATPGSTYLTFIYCSLSGILSCIVVRFFNKRTDMVIQWLLTAVVTSLLTVSFVYIGAFSNREILYALIGNLIHITGTQVVIAIVLPILERVFNLPTVFRLNELSYGNNPLLAKLADAAPGTYSHSKMVSELSESATKAIGANYNLARVGGLYHDIGKTEHPEYFVENQSGTNKHQELNPSLSVSIIKSHVKVGADNAREAGLPAELIDIIANHHGNDIIAYFYNEAKKQADDDDIVSSTDFSYSNSNIPESKECAIVMLADSVEAAARTVSGPNTAKFSKLINSIVFGKIERGQLDNCDLSMKEIDIIRDSFLKTLSAQYHNRIEYPDEEEEK